MQRKNIIRLVQYSHPEEILNKQYVKETNKKFYSKINSLKPNIIKIRKLSPVKKIKKNFSLPKLKIKLLNINNKEKDKNIPSTSREKEKIINSRDKHFNKLMTFEEKMILNYYENAISQRMKAKPKRINDQFFKQIRTNFQKSKENYRKIDEMKLIKDNIIYKKILKGYAQNYANFSNKIMDKSWLSLRNKFKLKIV